MLTILTISFGGPKAYNYLMDSRSVIVPKKDDVLQQFIGCTRRGITSTEMKVLKVAQVNVLPSHVKTVINITDVTTKLCQVYKLSDAAIAKLSTLKDVTKKVIASKTKKATKKMWCDFSQTEKDKMHHEIRRSMMEIVKNVYKEGGK